MSEQPKDWPEGFTPAFEYIGTPEGVVEFVHPAGEALERVVATNKGRWDYQLGRYWNEPPCGAPQPGWSTRCTKAKGHAGLHLCASAYTSWASE